MPNPASPPSADFASSIPRLVWRLYARCPPRIRAFAWARTLICPFGRLLDAVPKEGRIVDVGCGTGLFANLLALQSGERWIQGYDLDPTVIAAAQTAAAGRANIAFAVADVSAVMHQSTPPVAVTAIDLFHHLPPARQPAMIQAIYAMLGRGGLFMLKDIDATPMWKRWANWWHDALVARGNPRIFVRSRRDYEALLAAAGFTVETVLMPQAYLAHVLYLCRKN